MRSLLQYSTVVPRHVSAKPAPPPRQNRRGRAAKQPVRPPEAEPTARKGGGEGEGSLTGGVDLARRQRRRAREQQEARSAGPDAAILTLRRGLPFWRRERYMGGKAPWAWRASGASR